MKKIIAFLIIGMSLFSNLCVSAERQSESLFYEDFSRFKEGALTASQVTFNGSSPYSFYEGQYRIIEEDGNKILRLRRTGTNVNYPLWRINIKNTAFPDARALIIEYRVRNNIFRGSSAYVRSRTGSTYGTHLPKFQNGNIYASASSSVIVGTYRENEWVTVTNVLKTSSSSNRVSRSIYINGRYVKNITETVSSGTNDYANNAGALNFNFNLVGASDSPTEYFDIDYVSVYTDSATTDIWHEDTYSELDGMELRLSNPVTNSNFKSCSSVYDTNGVKVATVSDAKITEGNDQGNGFRIKLTFAKELMPETEYVLKITSLADMYGKLTTKDIPFETRPADYLYNDIVISKREENGKIFASASVVADNNTKNKDELMLFIGGFKSEDGAYKMIGGTKNVFTFKPDTKGQHFVTDEVDITGYQNIKCSLWNGEDLIAIAQE